MFMLPSQQVGLPRTILSASIALLRVRQFPAARFLSQPGHGAALRAGVAGTGLPSGALQPRRDVCCRGAAPVHRCHVAARRELPFTASSSEQGMHREPPAAQTLGRLSQPQGREPETG